MLENWILTLTIFAPTLGAVVIGLLSPNRTRAIRAVAMGAAVVSLILAAVVVGLFMAADPGSGYVLEQDVLWIGPPALPGIEIRYHLGVDGLSVFLLALAALLGPLVVLGSRQSIRDRQKEYYILLLVLGSACMGVFCAVDLLLFFIFFEFTLLPLYFLIGIWGSGQRRYAATKFFIYTLAGSVLTFAGVLYLAIQNRAVVGTISFDMPDLMRLVGAGVLDFRLQCWLFAAMFAGFAIKVPLFPLHTWLPLAHTEAPTAGSVILAAVLLKLGTYGFLRFCLPILPHASFFFAPALAALAVIAIIYGALAAWAQGDFKRLVAYSSVSHMGFCMLGMFSIKPVGIAGSVLYMINHGISTAALFFVVGMIYDRFHTRKIADLSGLASRMPKLTAFAVLFGLSSIALPGLNGFVSEFMVLLGAFTSSTVDPRFGQGPLGVAYAIVAAGGIVLSAVYVLYLLRRVFFGELRHPAPGAHLPADIGKREIAVLAPLAVLVIVLGLYPGPVIRTITPACRNVARTVIRHTQPPPTRATPVLASHLRMRQHPANTHEDR